MFKQSRLLVIALLVVAGISISLAQDGRYIKYQRILLTDNDSVKCAQLVDYAVKLADSLYDYNLALLIFEKANALPATKNYPALQLKLYHEWALVCYKKGDFEATDKLVVKVLQNKVLDSDPALKARILNIGGATLQNLQAYKRALTYYNEALEIHAKLNDIKGKGIVYQNMANIFALNGELAQSDLFFDKAMKIFRDNNLADNYGTAMGNKAYIKWKLGQPDSAKALLIRSFNIRFKNKDGGSAHIGRYFNMGVICAEMKQWDSCFYYLGKGKHLGDSLHLSASTDGTYYYNMGYCYASKGELSKAIYYYKLALGLRKNISSFRTLYENIAGTYYRNKQFDSAFIYKEKVLQLVDSIYKSELNEHTAFEKKRIELLEKDYRNEMQAAEQERSLRQLEKRNYLLISIILALIIFVMLFFVHFRQYKLKIKKEHLQSELDFLKAQLNPHFLFNSINNIYVLLDENKKKASEILLKFSDLMRYQLYECNVSAIRLSRELQFLENYIEFEKLRYSNKISVNSTFSMAGAETLLIAPLLLQPFIENAFKHTPKNKNQQSQIEVRAAVMDNELLFEVSNTVDVKETSALPGGVGLENVRKRLKLLYAGKHHLHISSSETFYKITLKLTLTYD